MRLRTAIGCLCAVAAVAVAGPSSWLPWGAWVHGLMPAWWAAPLAASTLLLAGAWLLPGQPPPGGAPGPWPTVHRADSLALGLGLLLLAEPALHLAVLAYLARSGAPGAEDLLLPLPPAAAGLPLRLAVLCVLAPLAEELFFRGRLLPWLALRLGPLPALSITSLAFAAAHGSPLTCLVALPVGVLLGWLRLHRRDLGACVLVHQAHNGLFLLAGPALVTAPVTVVVLVIGGLLLLILAAVRGPGRWRALFAGLGLAAGLALVMPPLLALKERLWADATARLCARAQTGPRNLAERLEVQRLRGRLTPARSASLRLRLETLGSDAARVARLYLDGPQASAADPAEATADLQAALRCVPPPPALGAGAVAIGRAWPGEAAMLAVDAPEALAALLGPDGALEVLAAAQGGDRRRLLAGLERAWPGRLASVLFRLPPEGVTALDRRHLRLHYADADALIAALDPARRHAWSPP